VCIIQLLNLKTDVLVEDMLQLVECCDVS